jgi:transcription initiation factor TFIIIB Brf1 subunit/transcription initiation factor TFIIB
MADADFDLFEKFVPSVKQTEIVKCKHFNTSEAGWVVLCTDCGEEILETISQDKEWRYYGQSDTKHTSDPNRCQMRRAEEDKNIFKDVEGMGFKDAIVTRANEMYLQVTKDKIHRGNMRKAIIFACIFNAYKVVGNPQSCEPLIEIFRIDRKSGLKGLKIVNLGITKDSLFHNTHITPANLVDDIMNEFSASSEQKKEVVELYNLVKGKSAKINRSRPQSVAAGLAFFWICKNNKNITIKEFSKTVKLSELTVSKVTKEISAILGIKISI